MTYPAPRMMAAKTPRRSARRAPSQPPTGEARFGDPAGQSAADTLYRTLREAIRLTDLRPGTPISEHRLGAEHGLSRTPVREALMRLAKERLVETVPRSGTFVGRIPISAVIEATVVRRALEPVALRRAMERHGRGAPEAMRAAIDEQRSAAAAGDLARFHRADEAFHAAIGEAAGYEGIWDLIAQVKIHADRYRHITLPARHRIDATIAEHTAVTAAMEAGDPARAERALLAHLDKFRIDVGSVRRRFPELFVLDQPPEA